MEVAKKYAYRYLMYDAMLCIRPIRHLGFAWWERWNPVYWLQARKRIQSAGAVANWMHNLALYSANDFDGFEEDAFWTGLAYLERAFPGDGFERYREIFASAVFEFNQGRWPTREEQAAIRSAIRSDGIT